MEIFDGHRALPAPLAAPAVAVGNFDGVHLGHRALLGAAVAGRGSGPAVAYTFYPHPATVLAPGRAPAQLTSRARRLELIADCGIDICIVEPFTRELAAMSADAFADVLSDAVGASTVIVGYDFAYGSGRTGNADTLRAAGDARGFRVEVVEAVASGDVVASSTAIRELVSAGRVADAKQLLGRHHDVDGTVVRGAGRGRQLGVPTANVDTGDTLLPAPGIYAGRARPAHDPAAPWHTAAISLGTNPTFETGDRLVLEVHLLDFDGDLYDQTLRVEFWARLRDELHFDGVDALMDQIRADIADTRAIVEGGNVGAKG